MKPLFYKITLQPEECYRSGAGPETGQMMDVSV